MKIELYLKEIQQDFPDNTIADNKTNIQWDNWYEHWDNKPSWYQKFHQNMNKNKAVEANKLKMRKESFGGVIFHSTTSSVYKVDLEGYKFLELLQNGYEVKEIADKLNLPEQLCYNFLREVKNLELW